MSKKQNKFSNTAVLNNQTYIDIYNRLQLLAMNSFEWVGVPDSVDVRFLEYSLYWKGYCLYFNDEILGNLALTCAIGGQLDVYRIPTYRRAYASNGYQKECSNKDSVLIFNNYLHTPTDLTIRLYALRLSEILRAIDVNVKQQKTPKIVLCDETQRLSMQNLFLKYDGNEPFIFGDKNLAGNLELMNVLDTTAPYVADKMLLLYRQIWNEAMTFCGIENNNQDKKERLVAAEAAGNYGQIEAERNVMLNERRFACDKINRMFGTNISVRFRSNLPTLVNGLDKEVEIE